jgi:hypothetical protein
VAELTACLCAATSLFAAGLLLAMYVRRRTGLLLWSALGFAGLAANNTLMFIDLVVVPAIDLSMARAGIAAAAMLLLTVGLIAETV